MTFRKINFIAIVSIIFSLSTAFSQLYKENVTASFYADDFHGKNTSSGEIFNMNELTCANKLLPFGTVIKVTNRANGKSVQVRVNDRGPFVSTREIDLSKTAAKALDMIKTGTAQVDIEIVKLPEHTTQSLQTAKKAASIAGVSFIDVTKQDFATSSVPAEVASSEDSTPKNNSDSVKLVKGNIYDIQLGAFSKRENAQTLAEKLIKAGFKNVAFQTGGGITRVVLRRIPAENVRATEEELKSKGYSEYTIKLRR